MIWYRTLFSFASKSVLFSIIFDSIESIFPFVRSSLILLVNTCLISVVFVEFILHFSFLLNKSSISHLIITSVSFSTDSVLESVLASIYWVLESVSFSIYSVLESVLSSIDSVLEFSVSIYSVFEFSVSMLSVLVSPVNNSVLLSLYFAFSLSDSLLSSKFKDDSDNFIRSSDIWLFPKSVISLMKMNELAESNIPLSYTIL